MIQTLTKYIFKGKEYFYLKEIKEEIHNIIGLELMDQIQRVCPLEKHKDYEKLLNLICSPKIRNMLVECLTVTFYETDDEGRETARNILDLK